MGLPLALLFSLAAGFLLFPGCSTPGLAIASPKKAGAEPARVAAPAGPDSRTAKRPPLLLPGEDRPGTLAEVDLSSDAAAKTGPFWLEQHLELRPPLPEGPLGDLYLSLDAKTGASHRLRFSTAEVVLEQVPPTATAGQPAAKPQTLARAPLGVDAAAGPVSAVLGALWRGGELTAWWNERLLLTWRGAIELKGPSGAASAGENVVLGPRRALALEAIRFRDDFMRTGDDHTWQPASGKWELTALAFPDRSANPFSLRVSFDDAPPSEDLLYKGRVQGPRMGLGMHLGESEGTFHVVRITGGSPAARAGLQEDDTIVAVDGRSAERIDGQIANRLFSDEGEDEPPVRLTILRTGEKQLREFVVKKGPFRWGTPLEGQAIQPVKPARRAIILGGEPGWSDYTAEVAVKPLGRGACGLAIAALSPDDCLLLRWLGPAPQSRTGEPPPAAREEIQLLRIEKGQETLLASKPLRYRPYEFHKFSLAWRGQQVVAAMDETRLFTVTVPALRRGRVGLYAEFGDPVFFDDVAVTSSLLAEGAQPGVARSFTPASVVEPDMERWANPVLEWDRDGRSPWAVHTLDFPGAQSVVLHKPQFTALEIRLNGPPHPEAPLDAQGRAYPRADTLSITDGRATLAGGSFDLTEAALRKGPYTRISLREAQLRGQTVLEAEVDGERFCAWPSDVRDAAGKARPLQRDGDRIAIRGLKNLGDPATVRVSAANVLDYTFESAPADWKVESGRWGLMNKWVCDPRWSWFGGRSETVAAIWNKRVFAGDITVDAWVALMMRYDDPPYDHAGYERPGDYNLVLCGDGVNLDTGYTLICGGGGNYWTRLYRNGKVVAEATGEEFRLPTDRTRNPDKIDLHQRWFHLRLEKRGNRVAFYRDGARAFEFTDPEPLAKGRVAFWTCQNGVLLSRLRIAHQGCEWAPLESRLSASFEDDKVTNLYEGEVTTRIEPVSLPPQIAASLALPAWKFPAGPAAPSPGRPVAAVKAWRVTNGTGGGPLALTWKRRTVDPATEGVVRFAVCIEPGTAVDFFLQGPDSGNLYRWRMTGPAESDDGLPLLGTIPGVSADGKWHAVQFALGPSWNAYCRRRGLGDAHATLRPLIGCLDNHGYALAGFTGNRCGAAYAVSDLTFFSSADVDREPPRLLRAVWPYDPDGDGRSLKLVFSDPGGSGVDFAALRVALSKQEVSPAFVRLDDAQQTATVDLLSLREGRPFHEGERLELSFPRLADYAGNAAPEAAPPAWTFHLAEARAAAKPVPQPLPYVAQLGPDAGRGAAEGMLYRAEPLHLGDVQMLEDSSGVCVEEVADAPPWAPAGARSLRVSSLRDGTHFGFQFRDAVLDLKHYPFLEIEYRIPFETPTNLYLGDDLGLMLTDVGDAPGRFQEMGGENYRFLPRPKDFVDDGTWRRVTVPARQQLLDTHPAAARGRRGFLIVGGPEIAARSVEDDSLPLQNFRDAGWRGNRKGMWYEIHAVRGVPAARSSAIAFAWQARDLAGATEYAASVDDQPDSVPAERGILPLETIEAAARRRAAAAGQAVPAAEGAALVSDGWKYLHLRVRNAAGVWSPVAHLKFLVDNTPPRLLKTDPPDGGALVGKTFRLHLADASGILPSSLRLRVNGKSYRAGNSAISFDTAAQVLTFNGGGPDVDLDWKDGETVEVELGAATDFVGNQLVQPLRCSFKVDRTGAPPGPAITKVRWAPANVFLEGPVSHTYLNEISMALDFEVSLGHVHALRDVRLDWTDDPATAAFGRRAVRFTALEDDADVQIMLHRNAWQMDHLPQLHFDYKTDGGVPVDIQAMVLGEWYTLRFLGPGAGPGEKNLGVRTGVQADGQWHHAAIDLAAALEQAHPQLPVRIISQVVLSAHGRPGSRRGATLWLDNVALSRAAGRSWLEWEAAPDPTGIDGYSYVFDEEPQTEAPLAINVKGARRVENDRAGTWYAHIRACNQAGKWGPTRHYRMDAP